MSVSLIAFEGVFAGTPGRLSVVSLLRDPRNFHGMLGFSLLQDPVGTVVLVLALGPPIFSSIQIFRISSFVQMNARNIMYRIKGIDTKAINDITASANRAYSAVGTRRFSAALLVFCAGASLFLDVMLHRHGMLAGWNGSHYTREVWRQKVYDGWWGNPRHHFILAALFWLLGIYYFYFLSKQLSIGFIFVRFIRRLRQYDFSVTPNVQYNTDGYWGLRPLRYFMQTTYCSTLCDFIMTLGVFMVWFPFCEWTALMELSVMAINFSVVVYPSLLVVGGSINEKKLYIETVVRSRASRADREATIKSVWDSPNLPFHIKSTLTALTIYLLVPLLLAVVSNALPK